jgi:protein TonB
MKYNSIRNISYSASLIFHVMLFIVFLLLKFSFDYSLKDFVEISFGTSGGIGSSGAAGDQLNEVQEASRQEDMNTTTDQNRNVEEVELPQVKNPTEQEVITPADKKKEKNETNKTSADETQNSKTTLSGQGNKGTGESSFGFEIDWGGKGTRRIYSFILPEYPEGVNKEIDIRLKFSIMPDGTVGNIIPLTKADTRLENAAINSLRQWRFEPLGAIYKQVEQTAVIAFPYRLK